jgi:hypothetical protein
MRLADRRGTRLAADLRVTKQSPARLTHRRRRSSDLVGRAGLAAMVAAALATALGCAGDPPPSETIDTVRFKLDFGGGVTLTSVDYVLTGPGSFRRVGTLSVGDQASIMATFSNLPAGQSYDITVKGTASDDSSFCKGEVTFSVAPMMDAVVTIPLMCSGLAVISADINICPTIDSLSVTPAEVQVGSSMVIVAEAHDPDNGPAPLSATWAAMSGNLTNLSTTGATFTCTAAGTFTISLRISDGTPGTKCADTASVTVTCSLPPTAMREGSPSAASAT